MDLGDGKFVLQWNDFEKNAGSTFGEMRKDQEFVNVTLVSDDDKQIEAHKVILAASSSFFDNMLRKNSHHHPLIYLKGVKGKVLVSIIDFIYIGEVTIKPEELEGFMDVGRNLQIKGLEASEERVDHKEYAIEKEMKLKTNPEPKIEPSNDLDVSFSEESDSKTDIGDSGDINIDKLEAEISRMIEKGGKKDFTHVKTGGKKSYTSKGYTCKVCGVEMPTRQKISNHIEGKHIKGYSHHCITCNNGKIFSSRVGLSVHQSMAHRSLSKGNSLRKEGVRTYWSKIVKEDTETFLPPAGDTQDDEDTLN